MKTYNDGLEQAASWIENYLKDETNERVIEFGNNMVMSIRAQREGVAICPVCKDEVPEDSMLGYKTCPMLSAKAAWTREGREL